MPELPQVIPQGRSNSIASYDYVDLANGLGFVNYYGVSSLTRVTTTGTAVQSLVTNPDVWPTDLLVAHSGIGSTTYNFDSTAFNLPRTAKGTAIFNAVLVNAEADSIECTITVQLFKIQEDNTAVSLGNSVQWLRTTDPIGAGAEENMLINIPLTQTIIKRGEKLRLAVTLDVDSDANDTIRVYCDPQGRDTVSNTDVSTQMKLMMSFRVDS